MKLRGAAKKAFLARMARGRVRRRRNPSHQLQLGDLRGQPGVVWGQRAEPHRAAPAAPHAAHDSVAESAAAYYLIGATRKEKARFKKESLAYAPKESPARKRARAKRAAEETALRAWRRSYRSKKKPAAHRKAKPHRKAPARRKGKLSGAAKAEFLRRMAAGRRAASKGAGAKKHKPHKKGKLKGAAKAAFLARMAAGRGTWAPHTAKEVYRAQHRKGVKRHLHALEGIGKRSKVAGRTRINPRTGAITMTKVANPKKRRRARNPSFRGVVSSLKSAALPMALGGVAGLGAGYLDAKVLGDKPTVSILAKIGLAVLGAALIGQKHPMAAAGWAGGMVGSTGYHAGVAFGGGMVGLSPASAIKGIADMAADDPEMANLIAGLGDVVDDNGMGDAADEYNQALADADDDMGEVVEDAA